VLGRECNRTLCSLLSCACFPPILTQNADKKLGKNQTMGMGQPLSQRERFIAPLESLVRIAKVPQSDGGVRQAIYARISPAIAEGERSMALRIIEGDRYFVMFPGGKELPHPVRGIS
jgi:hypothetical protein